LGGFHTCVIKNDGTGACWGRNEFGQSDVPSAAGSLASISAGWHHSCALNTTRYPFCWGRPFYSRSGATIPEEVYGFTIKAISAGYDHTCVLKEDGTPFCWGWGSDRVGVDGYKQAKPHKDTDGFIKLRRVSSGTYHSCGIKADGTGSVCWGRNDFHQSETPPTIRVGNILQTVGSLVTVVAGHLHTCGLRADARGVCWGNNIHGQTLHPISGLNLPFDAGPLKMISTGLFHNCAIRNNGMGICWGFNHYRQADPVPLYKLALIGAGDYHSCASSDASGTVQCWGWNNYGQSAVPAGLYIKPGGCWAWS